ncbi:MAG: hypothetical protein HY541_08010 [Deltaproteobacteria bacterium]|nr:hypothetical protein [Deltaproteobacteria bacterium]
MKLSVVLVFILAFTVSSISSAAVKLRNSDSDSLDIQTKCGATETTTDTSIAGSTVADIGTGPCTVTVKKTSSSATAEDGQNLIIKEGKVAKE